MAGESSSNGVFASIPQAGESVRETDRKTQPRSRAVTSHLVLQHPVDDKRFFTQRMIVRGNLLIGEDFAKPRIFDAMGITIEVHHFRGAVTEGLPFHLVGIDHEAFGIVADRFA